MVLSAVRILSLEWRERKIKFWQKDTVTYD